MNLLSAPSARASRQTSSVIHQQQQRADSDFCIRCSSMRMIIMCNSNLQAIFAHVETMDRFHKHKKASKQKFEDTVLSVTLACMRGNK